MVAYFLAAGVNQFVGAAFVGDETEEAGPQEPHRPSPSRSLFASRRRADGILRRNLFDHTLGPQDGRSQQDDSASRLPSDASGVPPKCEGAVNLVSTVVSDDPNWSFAALNGGGKTLLYRVGSEIEGKQISRITWQYVFLATGGSECYLSMFEVEAPAGRPQVGGTVAVSDSPGGSDSSSTGDSALDQVIDQSIEKVSENEYTVERSLVDRLLENQATLMRTARILPHEENGAVTGFKIYGVRRSSLLGKIGLHNGDIIHSINGYDMTSPDKALEAYARLRTADRLTVRITRRGSQMNMDYNIR
jgi:general secretion pathway protein C